MYRTKRRHRSYRKKSLKRSRIGFKKQVTRIARRAVGSEGKILEVNGFNTFTQGELKYHNLMWNFANSTGQSGVIGEQVMVTGFRLGFGIKNSGSASSSNTTSFRIVVARMRIYEAGSAINQWVTWPGTFDAVFRTTLTGDPLTAPVQTDVISKVYYDKIHRVVPQIAGATDQIYRSKYIKIGKTFRWEGSVAAGAGRQYDYYVFCIPLRDGAASLTDTVGTVTLNATIYFRDA